MKHKIIESLKTQFSFIQERPSSNCPAVNVPSCKLVTFAHSLRDDFDYKLLVDATAVDWSEDKKVQHPSRFSVVYHVFSLKTNSYLRFVSDCTGDDESPKSHSLAQIWPAADWHERETFDMFGIHFANHPDLRRILMWDDYPYHPLRKEFPLAGIETALPAADVAEATAAKVDAAPMMGGPFVSSPTGYMSSSEPSARDQSWTEKNPKPQDYN